MKLKFVVVTLLAILLTVVGGVGSADAAGYRSYPIIKTLPVAKQPFAASVNSVTDIVYLSNPNDNTVTELDGATNTVLGTPIPVGKMPYAVGVNPNTNKMYVPNRDSHSVSVIDGATHKVIKTIDVGSGGLFGETVFPTLVAVNPKTGTVYVTNSGYSIDSGTGEQSVHPRTLLVIDGQSGTVITTIPLKDNDNTDIATRPYGLAVNPETNIVYVDDDLGQVVTVIDGATNTILGTIPVTVGVGAMAVNPATNTLYVADDAGNNKVSVIDGLTNTVVKTINVGTHPVAVAVSVATNTVYVSDAEDNSVAVIDGATNSLTGAPISVGAKPAGLVFNDSTRRLYVADFGDNTVTVANEWISPTITSARPPIGSMRRPYSFTVTASGFPNPTFSVTGGTFPPGLKFNTVTGEISGVPAKSGPFAFTITASNGTAPNDAVANYVINIS